MSIVISGDTGISPVTPSGTSALVDGMTVGRGAGEVSTNTAVGASALAANTTGVQNNAFGVMALQSNISGYVNTAIGDYALRFNTTGNLNTGSGSEALYKNTSGSYNVAYGAYSLHENTTASNNTAVGYQAGYTNTTGSENLAMGNLALYSNLTGNQNVAIGKQALYTNTGTGNTATGYQAMYFNTSGGYNAAYGFSALALNTTGSYNVSVGHESLKLNTTASNNTAVGYQAGYSGTTGNNITAVGYQAGYSNTTGTHSTLFGFKAGYASNNSAAVGGNTLFGAYSGYQITTGTNNNFFGGLDSTGVVSSGSAVTTGSKNTILGSYSGNQGGLDIRTASNYIVLSDGDGNPHIYSTKSGVSTQASINVGTGGGNAALSFTVNTALKWNLWYDGNNDKFQITDADYSNGVQLAQNSNAWAGYSDARLKQNVVSLTSGLDVVLSLQPVTYEWKKDSKSDVGFIAQQVKESVPFAVIGDEEDFSQDEDGKVSGAMGIMHDKLVPYLVKAIQELKAEFDAYKEAHP